MKEDFMGDAQSYPKKLRLRLSVFTGNQDGLGYGRVGENGKAYSTSTMVTPIFSDGGGVKMFQVLLQWNANPES